MVKPSIPKGTRDFLPSEVYKRNFIFDTIEDVFKRYGYLPIETAAMENLQTLTGKYGEEGDKLLFKVLNNGDFLSKADEEALSNRDSNRLIPSISKRGLRYDLTVPFARFVVMHQNDLQFPFKRYQIQPVWRADRPQKGRYQEFYQCDVDVVGSDSLMYEAELVKIYDEVFDRLGIEVTIQVNHRKILLGLAEMAGLGDRFLSFAAVVDKMDKIGEEGVRRELAEITNDKTALDRLFELFRVDSLDKLSSLAGSSQNMQEGIEDLRTFHAYFDCLGVANTVVLDLTLARGLGYYTGCILEVKANDVQMGSIGGGGRYANLTESFGLANMPGVGISFGAERIYDVMEELELFDRAQTTAAKAIFLAFDRKSHLHAFEMASKLRSMGLAIDVYPEASKFKKQMKYASNRAFKYVVIVGEEELAANNFTLRNMVTGMQETVTFDRLYELLQPAS